MSNTVLDYQNPEDIQDFENVIDERLLAQIEAMDSEKPDPANVLMLPHGLQEAGFPVGPLYGYLRPDSGRHTVLTWGDTEPIPELRAEKIGSIGARPDWDFEFAIHGIPKDDGSVEFRLISADPLDPGITLKLDEYFPKQDAFSRHLGLIETDWMDQDCAVLCGCGSVGSCIALQMARSGVGRFILIDADCVEIHNVCRHQCSQIDIGRFKVDAVAERILQINPDAQIRKFYSFIQDVPVHRYADWISPENTVFIGTCDNRVGNATACDIAYDFGAPFLAIGFKPRAWAGELYVALPERHDICYRCAFKTQVDEARAEQNRNHLYMDASDPNPVSFVPGLDVDVEYGCAIASKTILDIFNRNHAGYQPRMLNRLGQYTIFSGSDDRSSVEPVWRKLLPQPLSLLNLRISEECRRCEHCVR